MPAAVAVPAAAAYPAAARRGDAPAVTPVATTVMPRARPAPRTDLFQHLFQQGGQAEINAVMEER